MKSSTTDSFWRAYHSLPHEIQTEARKAYRLWQQNPRHPSLRFERKKPNQTAERREVIKDLETIVELPYDVVKEMEASAEGSR